MRVSILGSLRSDQAQSIHVTPRKAKRSAPPTPDSKGSAKKVCVAASSSSMAQRDELVVGTESMLKANQELRQRLVDAGNRERDLMAQLQDMLTTVQLREQEMDKLRDDVAKARARAVEDDHLRVEYTALESKHKQAEAKCVDVEMSWAKDKEVLKQCQDELAATLRSTLSLNHVVDVLKEELQEAQAKASSATQRASYRPVRQLESDHQKLAHQLDMVHRTSDHEHETSAKEEVLVMKARFASARNAFRHLQTCMAALGEQIDIVPELVHYHHEATHGDGDEEDGDEETQCVLTERFARAEGEGRQMDQHASPRRSGDDDDDDATKQLVDTTEPATLYVKEDKEVEEGDGGAEYNVEYTDDNPEEFKWVKRPGPVKVTYANGDTFEGTFNSDKLKHGHGKYTWNEKTDDDEVKEIAWYDGAYENGKKHGVGKMQFPTGDTYHGQWSSDAIDGEGTIVYKNGDIFSGSFDQGIKHGKGTYEYADDKSQLIGNWVHNTIVDGKWLFKDGGYYTGRFENATPIGQCLLQFPNGLQHEGEYVKVDTINAAGDAVQVHTWKGDAVTKVF
ncbi:hypothetical protein DYB35_008461 [Aphanomyces astaci]|uniref:Uncharacterized protein n=1 Tax=Aphanomyces astaci TaxID=112090 RepID=A0A418D2G6_APHAT|nr:hypothetical protein DYB35_008461 [Aphanomyces astaci]